MPIPTPNKGENSKAFMARCMSNDVMQKEYPEQKQRLAVCYSKVRQKRGQKTLKRKRR